MHHTALRYRYEEVINIEAERVAISFEMPPSMTGRSCCVHSAAAHAAGPSLLFYPFPGIGGEREEHGGLEPILRLPRAPHKPSPSSYNTHSYTHTSRCRCCCCCEIKLPVSSCAASRVCVHHKWRRINSHALNNSPAPTTIATICAPTCH